MKRQRRRAGDVVRIDLGAGFHTYARVLLDASFAFYDCRHVGEASLLEILASRILFRIAVMNHAVKTGRWPVIGHEPLNSEMLILTPEFIPNPIDRTILSIYENGAVSVATREQCRGLERASVWEPEHVEDRLRAHYAGNVNHVVELLKLRDGSRTMLL
jgi:Immunity protein 26